MFSAQQFFRDRFSSHMKETSRYLKYIFNGHLVIAMLFIVSALAYYYQQWLANIPEQFPSAFIIAIMFGIIATYSPVRTLLKEPDLVFLLPAESKMGPYFRNAIIYSFIVQLYLILLVAAVLGPLYGATYSDTGINYLMIIVVLFILKVWNLLATWWMLRIRDPRSRFIDHLLRLILNFIVFYFFIVGEMLFAGVTTIILFGIFIYNYFLAKQHNAIVWDLLVEKDRGRMHTFYRFANMFTDVPHLKTRVKKRHWLVKLLVQAVPFKQEKSFDYLYRITTIRSGDYLGMYIRLLVIGALCIYFVPNIWVKITFSFLFLYLSAFQMMTLWQHHRTIAWLDLYPVNKEWRRSALSKWLLRLMLVQTIIFALLFGFLGNILGASIVLLGGLVFNYLFIYGYANKRFT